MNFRPELAEAVVTGRKTVTRRAVSDNPRSPYSPGRAPQMAGKVLAVCPGRGKHRIGDVRVGAVLRERTFNPGDIGYVEARREGFDSVLDFIEAWIALHGEAKPIDVWRIEFDPLPPPNERN